MKIAQYTSLLFPLILAACGGTGHDQDQKAAAAAEYKVAQLDALYEEYFDRSMELNPIYATFVGDNRFNDRYPNSIGPEHIKKSSALTHEYLDRLLAIGSDGLNGQDLLSFQIFQRNQEEDLAGEKFPGELMPLNQFSSTPNFFAQMGSGASLHPFKTVKDYQDFLGRIDGFVIWMYQARDNMREVMEQGLVQPRVLMEKVVPQLAAHVVADIEESLFYRPIQNMPESFSEEERETLTAAYRDAIENKLIPAYAMMRDFVRDEYLSATTESVGMTDLPGGDEWYAYRVATTTTTDLSPQEIHEIGLAEVERIHGNMQAVMDEVGFEGELTEFFEFLNSDPQFYFDEREQLIDGYRALREEVHAKALKVFDRLPKADYEIRAVEPFREKTASGGSYMRPSPDGSRPGVFYANAYDLKARPKWAMQSLFLHEAIPGHHFQGALTLEIENMPRFRKFGGYTAYSEGWGLYAESLGKEIGMYEDPYQYFGALNAELWRAIRLVVDTGLHYLGWTRQQVLDFMYANSATNEARAVAEAERYIAIPSQALAYKIGQLKISELRARAESALGDRFDIKAFHRQVLEDGPLPLSVLDAKIDRWIASQ
ncbi:MAG: DUF885 domain-containing protein [Gammaproteobacteria bacterium]|nr:DUF885 domain-containing protein [Gammaproteobacteria bacterium]